MALDRKTKVEHVAHLICSELLNGYSHDDGVEYVHRINNEQHGFEIETPISRGEEVWRNLHEGVYLEPDEMDEAVSLSREWQGKLTSQPK